ncbi:MAG: potassium channel protein, partial [Bacteroidetes bacterium]|nr:potassium channel protein [Bacteroidota bacterium]
ILGVVQGTSIVTMIGTVNRSMRSFNATLRRRGFIYIVLLTLVVILVGAAGMFAFERNQPGSFNSHGDAIWWTTMLLITIGSQYWPPTPAGKTLSVFISVYGFSVLGYITATLASFFVGRDAERTDGPVASSDDVAKLREQIAALSKLIEEQKGKDTSKERE